MVERRTPFYDIHVKLGAQMVKGGGDYMFPVSYGTPAEEHINTRTNVGMQDLSTMGKVDIKGPGSEKLVNLLLVNDVQGMVPGQVLYSTMCREDGGVLDDITVYKFDGAHFMIVTGSGNRKKILKWISDHSIERNAYITDTTAAIALPVIQGPRSRDYLKTIVKDADLDSLKYFNFVKGSINDIEIIISRTGYTGELGYELYTPSDEAQVLWDTVIKTGQDFGLKPYGIAAMQTLRLEKGYILYGNDVNETFTPLHAGLDRWIKFQKGDFIGKKALLETRDKGINQRLVGLIIHGDKPAAVKDPIISKDVEIGYVTYSNKGHTVGKMLALAYVKTMHAIPGTKLGIRIGSEITPGEITKTPFFDPESKRLHS
jgi:aminomethyltransferase